MTRLYQGSGANCAESRNEVISDEIECANDLNWHLSRTIWR